LQKQKHREYKNIHITITSLQRRRSGVAGRGRTTPGVNQQEAQLLQRDSASATYVFLASLTDRALH